MRSEWRLVIRQHVMVENAMRIGEMREMAGLIWREWTILAGRQA